MLGRSLRACPAAASPAGQTAVLGSQSCLVVEARLTRLWKGAQQQRRRTLAAAAGGREARGDRYSGLTSQQQQRQASAPVKAAPSPLPPSLGSLSVPAAPVDPSVLEARQWLLKLLPLQQFKAVGVSFDGRQSLIPQLEKDQAVACVREPTNPHDPHAVAITTLDGRGLGYIPWDKTQHFLQELCFGAVGSVGQQGSEGFWGFNVLVQPTLPPVEVYAFPDSIRQHVSLGMQLSGKQWRQLKQSTLAAAQGRCEVTGAALAAVHERWQFDEEQQVLRLLGFRAEAPEVQQIGGLLDLDPRAAEGSAALLQQLNCWSAADAQLYLQHARQVKQRRSAQQWRLDLTLLAQQGIPVPTPLQPLCI